MCHNAKLCQIGQTVFFQDGRRPPYWILTFLNFFVSHQVGSANMHRHTKFRQNRSNDCRNIVFNVFQNGGRPPSEIFIKF